MLQIGDNVEVIDELISGVVTKITPQEVSIRMENGIIITFPKKKVVKVDKNTPIEYHKFTNSSLKEEKKTKKIGTSYGAEILSDYIYSRSRRRNTAC